MIILMKKIFRFYSPRYEIADLNELRRRKLNIELADMDILVSCGDKITKIKEVIVAFYRFAVHPLEVDENMTCVFRGYSKRI